jgi:hypothetical protein
MKATILGVIEAGSLVAYLNIHDPWFELVAVLAAIAIIVGMPDPKEDSSVGYKWLFRSTHIFFNIASTFLMHQSAWRSLEPKAGILSKLGDDPAEEVIRTEIVRSGERNAR